MSPCRPVAPCVLAPGDGVHASFSLAGAGLRPPPRSGELDPTTPEVLGGNVVGMTDRRGVDPERFRALPEPVRLEDTITSEDTVVVDSLDDEYREVSWLLRVGG